MIECNTKGAALVISQTVALTSGARGGEATTHSQGETEGDRGCSRVGCARDSVHRDGDAVTTSRGRVP
jgi:hypothetical protein